jgi:thiol-disulfide isomerase/thioredoxin
MSDLSHRTEPPAPDPSLPIPVRKPLSRRTRKWFLVAMLGALVLVVVVAIVAAVSSSPPPERAVTISQEDRNAPVALRRAAGAIGFAPVEEKGVGVIESQPAANARPTLGTDLLEVGTKAPPFTLRTPAGRKVSLADYRGKAVLLEFFATWCPHCAAEAPHLRALSKRLAPSKVAFVSVDGSNADPASVYAYHVYFGLPYPALVDPDPGAPAVTFPEHGKRGKVSKAYGVGYFPTFYVIDRQGRITWRADGEQPDELLQQQLERAAAT